MQLTKQKSGRGLFWSPFVDEDDINVTVHEGTVTLTGTASTSSERQSAEHNAYEGGAKHVNNNIRVTYDFYGPSFDSIYQPYPYYSTYEPYPYH